ncbi:hypothetical protein B6D87_13270 [Pseudomonas fragi]|uniref:hypothetical protein n=1 Tax=Pseudomonas fragi TaxID=296 RepID=UPI000A29F20B|nr:hypothetical protein [Pseudomonas fragi]ARQ75128.1 hypothetical protein B6D87_13270 [Pseudomonas fragi]
MNHRIANIAFFPHPLQLRIIITRWLFKLERAGKVGWAIRNEVNAAPQNAPDGPKNDHLLKIFVAMEILISTFRAKPCKTLKNLIF